MLQVLRLHGKATTPSPTYFRSLPRLTSYSGSCHPTQASPLKSSLTLASLSSNNNDEFVYGSSLHDTRSFSQSTKPSNANAENLSTEPSPTQGNGSEAKDGRDDAGDDHNKGMLQISLPRAATDYELVCWMVKLKKCKNLNPPATLSQFRHAINTALDESRAKDTGKTGATPFLPSPADLYILSVANLERTRLYFTLPRKYSDVVLFVCKDFQDVEVIDGNAKDPGTAFQELTAGKRVYIV